MNDLIKHKLELLPSNPEMCIRDRNTTELIGIKYPNIIISLVFETDTHIEVQAKLDYPVYETTF